MDMWLLAIMARPLAMLLLFGCIALCQYLWQLSDTFQMESQSNGFTADICLSVKFRWMAVILIYAFIAAVSLLRLTSTSG